VHDDGIGQRVIKTLHRHGYRLVATVESHIHAAVADAQPAGPLPLHEAAALTSASHIYQAVTSPTGHLSGDGECKQITVLTAGVHGITALTQAHDPEALHQMLTRLFDMLRAEVQHVEGLVSQVT
jgi:NAD(P)-dependent dehydrogenase (short-subunit alcohol dehydrogenase family)